MKYKIHYVPLFSGKVRKTEHLYMHRNFDDVITTTGYVWYLEGASENILVDSGGDPKLLAELGYPAEKIQSIEEGLRKLGLAPQDIDIVIQTHLHFGHADLAYKYKNARFFVQKEELEFAKKPHPAVHAWYNLKAIEKQEIELIDGDKEIFPGITLLKTPGHSPGSQSVLVDTVRGKEVIEGLCCIEENFEPRIIPPAYHTDLLEAYDSLARLKKIADHVIPMHETVFF